MWKILLCLALVTLMNAPRAPAKEAVIAVVEDGPCTYFERLFGIIQSELRTLVGDEHTIAYKQGGPLNANWQPDRVKETLQTALNDDEVDLILTAGIMLSRHIVIDKPELTKPVVDGFLQDLETGELLVDQEGHSTLKNYTFAHAPLRSSRDLEEFRKMVAFKNLGIVVDSLFIQYVVDMDTWSKPIKEHLDCKITVLRANELAQDVLKQCTPDMDAVYLTPAIRMSEAEWQKVIDGLNEAKLPTFSMMGHEDVRKGAMAALTPDMDSRMARRLALNIQQVILGAAPEKLQVKLVVDEQMLINVRTVKVIGLPLSFASMMQADFIHDQFLSSGEDISLEQAVRLALENNLNLIIKQLDIDISEQERNSILANLLPQVEAQGQYSQIDEDRSSTSGGLVAETQTKYGLQASQVIFNDELISQTRAAHRNYLGVLEELAATRMDVMKDAAVAYIQFIRARALLEIEEKNLKLTKSNLELAKVRHQVGAAGPEEVYRWEAKEATDTASLIEAADNVELARVALNQVFAVDQTRKWQPRDIELKDKDVYFMRDHLQGLIATDIDLDAFKKFIVEQALANAPELHSLDRQIKAQTILLNQARRAYYTPDLSLSFQFEHTADETYAGEKATPQGPVADDDEWMLGVKASLPIFAGGSRYVKIKKTAQELAKLKQQREQIRQQIEQRARNAYFAIDKSYPIIALQRRAADRTMKNLEVIKEKYGSGAVSILDLLDAQNNAFVANQNAEIAVYQYLEDLYELQRTMAWFEMEQSEEEKRTWTEALRQSMGKAE